MANLNKFDPRLESLVMETKTHWGPDVQGLSAEDKRWVADVLHQLPHLASQIEYERSHTGFTRHITVTVADIEALYQQRTT